MNGDDIDLERRISAGRGIKPTYEFPPERYVILDTIEPPVDHVGNRWAMVVLALFTGACGWLLYMMIHHWGTK